MMTIKRKAPKLRTKVPLPVFTCKKLRCDNPIRWHGWCARHAGQEADRLFSRYIRTRDVMCVVCGLQPAEQCMHLISRRYLALRWSPENAAGGCRWCHMRYTHNPLAWDDWCRSRLGDETWDAMKFRAQRGGKPDLGIVIDELRLLLEGVA